MRDTRSRQWVENRRISWRYWWSRLRPATELSPLRIAFVYTVFGLAALFVSDVLFVRYFSEPLLSQIQALKGSVEVFLSAGIIFALTDRRESQLQRSMERLDRQREELQVLHRVLRHNLRNDLNVIQGYATRLRDELSTDRLDRDCEQIIETAEQMTRYTEQASRIRNLSDDVGDERTYDLSELSLRVLDRHPQVTDNVEVSTSLPDHTVVEAHPMFEEALEEVLTNAIRHNDAETPRVTLEVLPEAGPSHLVEIRVADDGPGIPRSELEPIQAGGEDSLLHLSGIGLWFVEWTVRHSGGELTFEDNERGGTTVVIHMPKPPEMFIDSFLR